MLRLAEQVRRHKVRAAAAVRQHQDFAGASDHVNGHPTEDLPLGCSHIDPAGAHNFIHPGHAFGAVGQGRHRLCAAQRRFGPRRRYVPPPEPLG